MGKISADNKIKPALKVYMVCHYLGDYCAFLPTLANVFGERRRLTAPVTWMSACLQTLRFPRAYSFLVLGRPLPLKDEMNSCLIV